MALMGAAILGLATSLWADDEMALHTPRIGVRQENLAPKYGNVFTFVWVHVPQIPGCILDLLTYEHSNMEYLGHRELATGAVEMRHRSQEEGQEHVLLVTTLTPEPGAVDIVARAEVDHDVAPDGELPDELPSPNLCFRLKRAMDGFSSFPDYFPEVIERCFIFTPEGRTFLSDTNRRPLPNASADDPRNNPPWVQTYISTAWPVPESNTTAGWYNTSTDRFTVPVMGAVSRDGEHLVALANGTSHKMTQAWQECLHNNPKWRPEDAPSAERQWHVKLYIMPNDPDALLARVENDFPELEQFKAEDHHGH